MNRMMCLLASPRSAALVVLIGAYGVGQGFQNVRASDRSQSSNAALRWYKGNTHTHTLNSDGDSTPDDVARWYREHGYRFLVLSDHNFLTSVDGLNALHGADEQFLLIRGEEITDRFGDKPIHINGLDLSEKVEPQHGSSVVDVVQRDVDAIRKAGGLPHINHPNYRLGDLRRRPAADRTAASVRNLQRSSPREQSRRRRRAGHGRSLGSRCSRTEGAVRHRRR